MYAMIKKVLTVFHDVIGFTIPKDIIRLQTTNLQFHTNLM